MDDFFERMKKFMPFVTILSVFCTLAISLGVIVYNSAHSDVELLYSYREMARELKIVSESQKAIDKRLDGIEAGYREINDDFKEMKADIKVIRGIQSRIFVELVQQKIMQH